MQAVAAAWGHNSRQPFMPPSTLIWPLNACTAAQTRNLLTSALLVTASTLVPLAAVTAYSGMSRERSQLMWGITANVCSLFYFASPLRCACRWHAQARICCKGQRGGSKYLLNICSACAHSEPAAKVANVTGPAVWNRSRACASNWML
jgi:hypothetical protein